MSLNVLCVCSMLICAGYGLVVLSDSVTFGTAAFTTSTSFPRLMSMSPDRSISTEVLADGVVARNSVSLATAASASTFATSASFSALLRLQGAAAGFRRCSRAPTMLSMTTSVVFSPLFTWGKGKGIPSDLLSTPASPNLSRISIDVAVLFMTSTFGDAFSFVVVVVDAAMLVPLVCVVDVVVTVVVVVVSVDVDVVLVEVTVVVVVVAVTVVVVAESASAPSRLRTIAWFPNKSEVRLDALLKGRPGRPGGPLEFPPTTIVVSLSPISGFVTVVVVVVAVAVVVVPVVVMVVVVSVVVTVVVVSVFVTVVVVEVSVTVVVVTVTVSVEVAVVVVVNVVVVDVSVTVAVEVTVVTVVVVVVDVVVPVDVDVVVVVIVLEVDVVGHGDKLQSC